MATELKTSDIAYFQILHFQHFWALRLSQLMVLTAYCTVYWRIQRIKIRSVSKIWKNVRISPLRFVTRTFLFACVSVSIYVLLFWKVNRGFDSTNGEWVASTQNCRYWSVLFCSELGQFFSFFCYPQLDYAHLYINFSCKALKSVEQWFRKAMMEIWFRFYSAELSSFKVT